MARPLPAALAFGAVCLPVEAAAQNAAPEQSDAQSYQLAIVDLRLRGRTVVASEIIAYTDPQGALYLPVSELFFLLDFPMESGAK